MEDWSDGVMEVLGIGSSILPPFHSFHPSTPPFCLAPEQGIRSKLNAMHSGTVKSLAILSILSAFAASLCAQTIPGKLIAPKRVEPGLETAVKWKWRVEPSDEKD